MKKRNISIRLKMHIFIMLSILAVAMGTAGIAFYTSANQIDSYYKRSTADNAENFASMVDADYLEKLRREVETEEYQKLRAEAEEKDDNELIIDHLSEKGLLEGYRKAEKMIDNYTKNIKDITYLYISVLDENGTNEDMYLVNSSDTVMYEIGLYEEREAELVGLDVEALKNPTISNGEWGYLCSAFYPVYNSHGKLVCVVGCDISMDEIMNERREFLLYLLLGALLLTVPVQIVTTIFMNRTVVKPLNLMTKEMKKFKPAENISIEEAGVIDLPIKSSDEIGAIYNGIRNMQINIFNNLTDMLSL